LPGNLGEARSQYQEWLIATTVEFFGENKVAVKPAGEGSRDDVYHRFNFTIAGEGNLEQFTRFLHRFYEMNYLHRIQSLRVTPIRNTKTLKITCEVESLMLLSADPQKKLGDEKGNRLRGSLEDDYLAAILGRNLFGPPNNPPEFSTLRSPSAEKDRSFTQTITARDADPLDLLSIRFDEGPPGMELTPRRQRDAKPGDPFTAELSWRPSRTGRYDVKLSVVDDGYPRKENQLAFTIDVRDPPPVRPPPVGPAPPPPFKHSRYTFLTSVQQVDGQGVVWFYTRTTNTKTVCREGEEFKIGDYSALVTRIDIDQLTVELDVEDEILVLALGQNLLDAKPKPTAKVGQTSPFEAAQ
jgi:hypothetical protein